MKVPLHKIQSCFAICVVVCEPQWCYAEAAEVLLLRFVLMTQRDFRSTVFGTVFSLALISSSFSQLSRLVWVFSSCQEWNLLPETFSLISNLLLCLEHGRHKKFLLNLRRHFLYERYLRYVSYSSRRRDSVVGTETKLEPWCWGIQIPAGSINFSLFQNVQTGSADHPAFYSVGTVDLNQE